MTEYVTKHELQMILTDYAERSAAETERALTDVASQINARGTSRELFALALDDLVRQLNPILEYLATREVERRFDRVLALITHRRNS